MKTLLQALLVLFPIVLSAQTGPGGVGATADNALWLRANSGTSTTTAGASVQTWNDMSGNGNNVSQATAAQRPLFQTNVINGYPAIQFDNVNTSGNNDFMEGADSPTLDNTAGLTIFTVVRMTNLGDARSIVAKRTNVGVNQAYMFFFWNSNYLHVDVASNDNRFSTNPTAYTTATNYLLTLHYDGSLSAPNRCKVYDAQTLRVTANETAASLPDYSSPLIVGSTHVGDNRPFGGFIAEIIIYRRALNDTERLIVDNYLSSKYNITLSANDFHSMDSPANGNYDHEVAGIGRRLPTELHNDSQGTSFLRINNPSGLGNNEYLFWGHDNGTITVNNTVDVDGAVIQSRLNRIWRLTETGDVGTVTVSFNVSGFTSVTGSDLRLLIDRDGDGFFDNDVAPISGTFAANTITFTGVNLQNGDRFTLGSINAVQTPLPVELLDFQAQRVGQNVRLFWETATEHNSSHFEIQRSSDGTSWGAIGQVSAAGFSAIHRNYNFIDHTPLAGLSYYRLRMVDLDGTWDYSVVRAVDERSFDEDDDLSLFPNPFTETITLVFENNSQLNGLKIIDATGRLIKTVQAGASPFSIDLSDLQSGVYYLVYFQGDTRKALPLVKYH